MCHVAEVLHDSKLNVNTSVHTLTLKCFSRVCCTTIGSCLPHLSLMIVPPHDAGHNRVHEVNGRLAREHGCKHQQRRGHIDCHLALASLARVVPCKAREKLSAWPVRVQSSAGFNGSATGVRNTAWPVYENTSGGFNGST